jgi:hypothetical protein
MSAKLLPADSNRNGDDDKDNIERGKRLQRADGVMVRAWGGFRHRKAVVVTAIITALITAATTIVIYRGLVPAADTFQTCTVFESPIYWRQADVQVLVEPVELCPGEYVESKGIQVKRILKFDHRKLFSWRLR